MNKWRHKIYKHTHTLDTNTKAPALVLLIGVCSAIFAFAASSETDLCSHSLSGISQNGPSCFIYEY